MQKYKKAMEKREPVLLPNPTINSRFDTSTSQAQPREKITTYLKTTAYKRILI